MGQNVINGESSKSKVAREEKDLKIVIFSEIYLWLSVYALYMHVLQLNSTVTYFCCNYSKVGIQISLVSKITAMRVYLVCSYA